MRSTLITVVMALLFCQGFAHLRTLADPSDASASLGCLLYIDGALYQLTDLKSTKQDYVSNPFNTVKVSNSTIENFIDFNICQTAVATGCTDLDTTFAVMSTKNTTMTNSTSNATEVKTTCQGLTNGKSDDVKFEILESGNSKSGIRVKYGKGPVAIKENKTTGQDEVRWQFELQLTCNSDLTDGGVQMKKIQNVTVSHNATTGEDAYKYIVMAQTSYACPQADFLFIWEFIDSNKAIFVILFGVFGVFLCFYGKKFIKYSLFLVGFILVFGAIMAFSFGFFVKTDTTAAFKWIIVAASAILGILFGYAISRKTAQKVGFFALGALLGITLGGLLYSLVLVRTSYADEHGQLLNIGAMVLSAIICGLIGMVMTNVIEVVSTAVFGSYIAFRVLGLTLGNYPTSKQLTLYVHEKNYGSIPGMFYFYMIGTVVLAIVGIWYQWRMHKRHEQFHKDKKHQKLQDEQHDIYRNAMQNGNQNYNSNSGGNDYRKW